jgi:hypothetical protein
VVVTLADTPKMEVRSCSCTLMFTLKLQYTEQH